MEGRNDDESSSSGSVDVAALREKSEVTDSVPHTAPFTEIEKWHLQSHASRLAYTFTYLIDIRIYLMRKRE